MRQHHLLSTTTPDNCKKFAFVAFFDGCDTSCAIGKLPFSFLLCDEFLRRIFSVCHSFRSMCQSRRMKGFERCFKDEDQGTSRRQNLHAAILRPPAKRIQIMLYERHLANLERSLRISNEPHLRKEKPVMGNIEPLLEITNLCQGNVNGRKSFAA